MREQGNSLLRMAEQLRVRTPLLCLALTIDGHVRKGRGGNNNTNKETRTLKESLPLLLKKRLFTKFQHVRFYKKSVKKKIYKLKIKKKIRGRRGSNTQKTPTQKKRLSILSSTIKFLFLFFYLLIIIFRLYGHCRI